MVLDLQEHIWGDFRNFNRTSNPTRHWKVKGGGRMQNLDLWLQRNDPAPSAQFSPAFSRATCMWENCGWATAAHTGCAWLSLDGKRGGWDSGIQAQASLGWTLALTFAHYVTYGNSILLLLSFLICKMGIPIVTMRIKYDNIHTMPDNWYLGNLIVLLI